MLSRAAASLTIALALFPTLPLGAQGFRYADGTSQYRASIVTRVAREIQGQRMEDEVTQTQYLTVALSRLAADTLRLGVTIDSATVAVRTGGDQDVSELVGLRVEGTISPVGVAHTNPRLSRDIGPAGAVVATELTRFLPRLRNDLRIGLAWTDTLTERIDMLGVPVQRQTITRSTVAGDTTVAGQRAWRVDRTASVAFTGSGSVTGQAISMEGTSKSEGHIVVSRAGRFLGSRLTDDVTTNFTIPATGMTIEMTQTQTTRIDRL